jgi:REP element-mobilizing transposase RayT
VSTIYYKDSDPKVHRRRSIRLPGYDYSQAGATFVTIVSHKRLNIFGSIVNGKVDLSQSGQLVEQTWLEIPLHFPRVMLDAYVIMPNHVHGILNINDDRAVGATHASPLQPSGAHGPMSQSIGAIVGSFKSAATKRIHELGFVNQKIIWQRNYYEHVIRDGEDYQRVFNYIETNPGNWEHDSEYASN